MEVFISFDDIAFLYVMKYLFFSNYCVTLLYKFNFNFVCLPSAAMPVCIPLLVASASQQGENSGKEFCKQNEGSV